MRWKCACPRWHSGETSQCDVCGVSISEGKKTPYKPCEDCNGKYDGKYCAACEAGRFAEKRIARAVGGDLVKLTALKKKAEGCGCPQCVRAYIKAKIQFSRRYKKRHQ